MIGDNGVLTQAQKSSTKTTEARFLEDAGMAYSEIYAEEVVKPGFTGVTEAQVVTKLKSKYGYTIEPSTTGSITAITPAKTNTEIGVGYTDTIQITPGNANGNYVKLNGAYYKINLSSSNVTLGEAQDNIGGNGSTFAISDVTSSNTSVATVEKGTDTVTITGVGNGTSTITVKYTDSITTTITVTVSTKYTVNLYASSSAETATTITVAEGTKASDATGYAIPTAPEGQVFDKWVLKTAVTGNTVGSDATGLLENVMQALNVYATFKELKLYGDQVQLNGGNAITVKTVGTTNYTIEDNWKLFYIDDDDNDDSTVEYVHLIYGDFYPVDVQTDPDTGSTNTINLAPDSTNFPWGIDAASNRLQLLQYLKNNSSYEVANLDSSTPAGSYESWTNLATALTTGSGKALNGKTIRVQGAPDITMWVNSWNEQGYTELLLYSSGNKKTGFNVRYEKDKNVASNTNEVSNYTISLSSEAGYGDTLYFPYTGISNMGNANKAGGYWLASPGGYDNGSMCDVGKYGQVSFYGGYQNINRCARPVVSIQKSDFTSTTFPGISITKPTE